MLLCLNRVHYYRIIYKIHKHYNSIKLKIIYKSNLEPSEEAWVWIDRETNKEKHKR